ncbi:MAG: hypothetical protein WD176_09070, partial [Pirellulales bacterium]
MPSGYSAAAVPGMADPMAPVNLPDMSSDGATATPFGPVPGSFAPGFLGGPYQPTFPYDQAAPQSTLPFGGQGVELAPVTAVGAPADESSLDVAAPRPLPHAIVASRRQASETRVIIGAVAALTGIVPLVFLLVYVLDGRATESSLADHRTESQSREDAKPTLPSQVNASLPGPEKSRVDATHRPVTDLPQPPMPDEPKPEPAPGEKMPDEKMPDEKTPAKPDQPAPMPPDLKPLTPKPVEPEVTKPARPSAVADMVRALTAAKGALGKRQVDQALIETQVATNLAQTPEQKAMCDRLKSLTHYVGEFWKAVRESMKGLKGGEELQIREIIGIVVESSPDSITIKIAGRNRTFDHLTLPSGVAEVLADRWLKQDDPVSKVIKGAFYAVDPQREPKDARRLWQEAQLAGADVEQLLPVLDDKYDIKSHAVAKVAPKKGAVPGPMVVDAAAAQIKSKFATEIRAAKSKPQANYDLVRKMLEEAALPMDSDAARYALICEARDIATNAKLIQIALEAVDTLEQWFNIDSLPMKAEAITKAAVGAKPAAAKDIALEALQLVDQAVEKKNFALADRLAKTANGAARASRQQDLMKRT